MKRMFISIVVLFTLLLALMPAAEVFAAESGTTSGSFTVGNVMPTVEAIELYADAGLTTVASTIIPQVTYYLKVTVASPNSLHDIQLVTAKIFVLPGGNAINEALITAGAPQTAAILAKVSGPMGQWTIDAGDPTSWTLETALCTMPADLNASSGYGVFAFKAGKVATESIGADEWGFFGRVTGSAGKTSGLYSTHKRMMWYGETTVNTLNVIWGAVDPGSGFSDGTNEVDNISVKYIANGDYQELVKSTATWAGSSNIATLDSFGVCVNAREFSLKSWYSDTYLSAQLVNTTGVSMHNEGQTGEAGDLEATNVLWLKLASTFPVDLYNGTITYIIANH